MKISIWLHVARISSIRWSTINANLLLLQPAFLPLMSYGSRDYHWANRIASKQLRSTPGNKFYTQFFIVQCLFLWFLFLKPSRINVILYSQLCNIRPRNFRQQFLHWFCLRSLWKAIQYHVIPYKWLFFHTDRLLECQMLCAITLGGSDFNLYSDHLILVWKNCWSCTLSTTPSFLGSRHLQETSTRNNR